MTSTKENTPMVTVIIPCRNEELFLEKCLNSVVSNDYPPDKTEILILDGISTDKTLEVAGELIVRNPQTSIRIIPNPLKIFPAAVNLGVRNATGEFIIILGAHALYDTSYIRLCVENALYYKADNVGGVLNTIGQNTSFSGKLITMVLSSSFGVGNSTFRTGANQVTEVDTVFGGCYHKSVFDRIGYFNENLISTSDMDFNVRLKRSGGKIILVPDIIAHYYTRTDFPKFMKNNFRNGFWTINPLQFVDYIPVAFRHLVPLFFVLGIIGGLILSIFSFYFLWLLSFVLSIYGLASVYFSFRHLKEGFAYVLAQPLFFFLLHFSYGIGSLSGLLKVLFSKRFYSIRFSKKT